MEIRLFGFYPTPPFIRVFLHFLPHEFFIFSFPGWLIYNKEDKGRISRIFYILNFVCRHKYKFSITKGDGQIVNVNHPGTFKDIISFRIRKPMWKALFPGIHNYICNAVIDTRFSLHLSRVHELTRDIPVALMNSQFSVSLVKR